MHPQYYVHNFLQFFFFLSNNFLQLIFFLPTLPFLQITLKVIINDIIKKGAKSVFKEGCELQFVKIGLQK